MFKKQSFSRTSKSAISAILGTVFLLAASPGVSSAEQSGKLVNELNKSVSDNFTLTTIAESPYQWTGIGISSDNRIFVNFPTWDVPSPYKVAEVVNGKTVAYPSIEANKRFIAVQSVIVDDLDFVWILDTANPQFGGVVKSGAKLYKVDTRTDEIVKTYAFPMSVATQSSYLNDVRIDNKRGFAYLTDSTIGGIVVLSLETGESWRALDSNAKSVQASMDRLFFESTGDWVNTVASDGISLSKDGSTLYYTALTGSVLYQVDADILRDKTLTSDQRENAVKVVNPKNVPTDGMLLVGEKLYMGDLPKEAVWVYDLSLNKGYNLKLNETIRWADSFAADKYGNVYFTTSQINYPIIERDTYKIMKLSEPKNTLFKPVAENDIKRNLAPIHIAVAEGNIAEVERLISSGADVNKLDQLMGIAPLHIAVQRHDISMIKLLADNGAFVNLQSVRLGGTPLLLAVWHRNVEAVAYLLSLPDIDISVISAAGLTAQQFNRKGSYAEDGSLNEDVDAINKLFEAHKQRIENESKHNAAIHRIVVSKSLDTRTKIEKIQKLIDSGKGVNAISPMLKQRTDFHSALLVAALTNQLSVAKLLLENGADQTLPGAYMAAIPLHKAAYNGHADMLKLLSQYPGYNKVLNAQGPNNGYTPLHDAVWHGHFDAVKVLVESGARIDLKGYDGNTPAELAVQNGYPKIAQYLKGSR